MLFEREDYGHGAEALIKAAQRFTDAETAAEIMRDVRVTLGDAYANELMDDAVAVLAIASIK